MDSMSEAVPAQKPDLKPKLREVPHKPGVYLYRDRLGRVIYVGKARDLRKRVGSYFVPAKKMRADPKTRALLDSVWDLEWHTVKSEPEAVLLEGRLIKEFRPKYNISFRDDKRFLLVRVDEREEWPRFHLARIKKDDSRYFGPYANSGALRETLKFLRKKFGVLTFGRGSPNERELKSVKYQVPVKLSEITAEQYRERVAIACSFLEGQSRELIEQLESEMRAAAEKLDFEKAAELRNTIADLRETTKKTRRFTRASLPRSIEPKADMIALQEALRLQKPPRVMECFDISNISTTHVVASMVRFTDGVPDRANYRRYRIKTVKGQDDFASMAEVVRRRYARVLLEASGQKDGGGRMKDENESAKNEVRADFSPEFSQENPAETIERLGKNAHPMIRLPDLIIVDGGRGQLSSACRELQRLGLFDLPIIGLAKEFEEIYRPAHPVPLRLPANSGALKLLQRIRDEAHRFANGYHQLLMKRRIGESILDECPGVSENRKQLLLKKFGSVARLRRASAEQIAAIEGIGARLAEQVVAFLAERK
jgi:excinuclease ABC subunit C